jgi:acetyl-CoA synthetase
MGRIDDVVNVSGHRLGTMEVESALVSHRAVAEAAVVGRPDDLRHADALPKTRSGKIMRRLLRDIASGKETIGDTTTLEDLSVLAKLREDDE